MTADIRAAAQREAERIITHEMPAEAITGALPFRVGFTDGAVWASERVTPTREQIATEIAKHSRSGDEIDGMFYCACGDGDYLEPNHIAEAVHALFGEVAGDE